MASAQPRGPLSPDPSIRAGAALHPESLSPDSANHEGTLPGQVWGTGLGTKASISEAGKHSFSYHRCGD